MIGITDKYLGSEPYFSEIGHLAPSTIYEQENQAKKIENLAIEACQTLGINFGMAHVEIKLSKNGTDPVIIEVGVRPAGDGIIDIYEKVTGKNIYELHCKAYLNCLEKGDFPKNFLRSAAIGYLQPRCGIIESIDYQKLGENDLKYVDAIVLKASSRQKVTSAKNWSTRYGFVEYTFLNGVPKDFELILNTRKLANKIFCIKEKRK